jgi:hypothetical protein
MDPTHAPLFQGPPPPPPKGQGEGEEEGGRKGRGGKWGKGGLGFHLAPPFPRPSLSHLWAGPPNFGASVIFTAYPVQKSEKTIGTAQFFFYNSKLIFFSLKGITLAHLLLKFQNFIHFFDVVRAYLNSPKTHFGTLVL